MITRDTDKNITHKRGEKARTIFCRQFLSTFELVQKEQRYVLLLSNIDQSN